MIRIKILLMIACCLSFISCSNITYTSSKNLYFNGKSLEVGDILLKKRKFTPLSIFGHTALVIGVNKVADLPKFGEKYYETDLKLWLQDNRDIVVLRYKNNSDVFKEKLLKNLEKIKSTNYGISFNKFQSENMYCSHFIWYLYFITTKEIGEILDIDGNKGIFVFPYDFLKSTELETIIF